VVQGDAKFLVVVNVSREIENRSQTKESLDFLAKISRISVESQPLKSSGMKSFTQKKRGEKAEKKVNK
jgi:hypothetical protein